MSRTTLLLAHGRSASRAALTVLVALVAAGLAATGAAQAATPAPEPRVAFSGQPEAFARYVGQSTCDPAEKPGTSALRELLRTTYGVANDGGIARDCASGGRSEHKEGRAYDWMNDAADPVEKARADAFVSWAVNADASGVIGGNARRLGIMYIIWNKRQWSAYSGGVWKPYTGSLPHTDHVHVSLGWDGAFGRTSWWTGATLPGSDYGPCALYLGEAPPPYRADRRNTSPCPTPVPRVGGVLAGDWDGDGDDEIGTFRDGRFALAVAGRTVAFGFGRRGDLPVVGDWDGDGSDDVGVFRSGQWYLRDSLAAGPATTVLAFGRPGDAPLVGRWSGDGVGIGVRRGAQWFLRDALSGGASTAVLGFGRATDDALVGDWDGDGVDAPGVRRGNQWFLARSVQHTDRATALVFGEATHTPVVGDWDGDGDVTTGSAWLGDAWFRDDLLGGEATRTAPVPF